MLFLCSIHCSLFYSNSLQLNFSIYLLAGYTKVLRACLIFVLFESNARIKNRAKQKESPKISEQDSAPNIVLRCTFYAIFFHTKQKVFCLCLLVMLSHAFPSQIYVVLCLCFYMHGSQVGCKMLPLQES